MPSLTRDRRLDERSGAVGRLRIAPGEARAGVAAAGSLAAVAGLCLWEWLVQGLPLAPEAPPRFDRYHFARSGLVLIAGALLVRAIVRFRARPCALDRQGTPAAALTAALVAMALAAAAIHLLAQDPAAFHWQAQEDRLLEWMSAALLLLGGGSLALACFAMHRTSDRQAYALAAAGALSLLLLVMAMEEISWGQRLLGFATPEAIAAANWQGEFNFHNLQTDLSEAAYYSAAALFLGFVPLLRDLLPSQVAAQPWVKLVPTRTAALVSAPVHMLSYGQWNLIPVQLASFLALFALFAWARAAWARGKFAECTALLALAAAMIAGQGSVLWLGAAMIDVPDASEYKEFFLAAGFACYGLAVSAALGARSPAESQG